MAENYRNVIHKIIIKKIFVWDDVLHSVLKFAIIKACDINTNRCSCQRNIIEISEIDLSTYGNLTVSYALRKVA